MPEPIPPPVPIELWRDLLLELMAYRRAEPWQWMGDAAASVHIEEGGNPWFACVLGAGRQVYGLCLYRGANGLRLFRELCNSGPDYDFSQLTHRQDAVTVWFGPKADLDAVQIQRLRDLGYTPKRGERMAWPDVRSHRPGLFPWHPEESEVRVLLAVVPAVVRLADLVRRHPYCYDEHDENALPTLPPPGSFPTLESLDWRIWLTPEEPPIEMGVAIDESDPILSKVKVLPVAKGMEIEVDLIFMPEPVSEGGRPFYPRAILIFRSDNGICCSMNLLKPDEDAGKVAGGMLLDVLAKLGCRTRQLLVCQRELAVTLAPLARQLGLDLRRVKRLACSDEFQEGMGAHMKRRHTGS